FFSSNSYSLLAKSAPITVGPAAATVTVLPLSGTPGDTITVTLANGPGHPTDWVGLYPVDAHNTEHGAWKYLSGSQTPPVNGLTGATVTFTLPLTPGAYNVRFFSSNSYAWLATSATVTVQGATVNVLPLTGAPGDTITVTIANGPG